MKTIKLALGLILAGTLILSGVLVKAEEPEIMPGDPVDLVTEALGEPQGYLRAGELEVYMYERGRVEVRDGKVTAVDLVSPEIALERRIEQELQRAEQELRREDSLEEGRRILRERLADAQFAAKPLAERMAFWNSFRHQYPGVGGEAEYQRLLLQLQHELAWERMQREVAELEQRALVAEDRARHAERSSVEAARRLSTVVVTPNVVPYYAPTYVSPTYIAPSVVYCPTQYRRSGRRTYVTHPNLFHHRSSTHFGLSTYHHHRSRYSATYHHPSVSITLRGR